MSRDKMKSNLAMQRFAGRRAEARCFSAEPNLIKLRIEQLSNLTLLVITLIYDYNFA
jgi:hypothetical protein